MHAFKTFTRTVTAFGFKLALALLATGAALIIPLSNPGAIKQQLASNHVYPDIVDAVIQDNVQAYGTEQGNTIDPATFKSAAQAAFTPALLQQLTENVIDGTYHWLEGKTDAPDFKLDVSSAKQTFADTIANQARSRANSLPVCTRAQLRTLDPQNINLFTISCRPAGFDVESQIASVTQQFMSGQAFLPKTIYTAQDLPKNADGKTFFESAPYVPTIYQSLKPSLIILAILTILTALALIRLHDQRRAGIRQVGSTLLGTGLFLAVSALIYIYLFKHANSINAGMNSVQPLIVSATHALFDGFNRILLIFSAVYVTLGGGLLFLARRPKPTPTVSTPVAN